MTKSKASVSGWQKLAVILFITYFIVLIWILLFKMGVRFSYMDNRQVNLIPFSSLASKDTGVGEIVMNVLIFVPVGVYLSIIAGWGVRMKLLLFFSISLLIETLQYTFRIGAFDVTDLLTNTSGGIVGVLLFYSCKKVLMSNDKAKKFLTTLAAIGTVMIIVFLVLLKTGNLWIRYQ